mmetsp:Transcript_13040/g.37996  ORF Transcript_13040/g.37996 Transcript_13040/m.37996 type:complete len:256 (-) Transcript_13040:862-1629(-)
MCVCQFYYEAQECPVPFLVQKRAIHDWMNHLFEVHPLQREGAEHVENAGGLFVEEASQVLCLFNLPGYDLLEQRAEQVHSPGVVQLFKHSVQHFEKSFLVVARQVHGERPQVSALLLQNPQQLLVVPKSGGNLSRDHVAIVGSRHLFDAPQVCAKRVLQICLKLDRLLLLFGKKLDLSDELGQLQVEFCLLRLQRLNSPVVRLALQQRLHGAKRKGLVLARLESLHLLCPLWVILLWGLFGFTLLLQWCDLKCSL